MDVLSVGTFRTGAVCLTLDHDMEFVEFGVEFVEIYKLSTIYKFDPGCFRWYPVDHVRVHCVRPQGRERGVLLRGKIPDRSQTATSTQNRTLFESPSKGD